MHYCKNWYKDLRAELLEKFGWLPQTMDTNLGNDEEFYYD